MNNELITLGVEDVNAVFNELEQAFYDIPFGNTEYQSKVFVLAAAITPERRYRAIGLQLLSALNTIKDQLYNKKIFDIDREENIEKLNSGELSKWDQKRLEVKMQHEDSKQSFASKMMNDKIKELNFLYSEFKKLPAYTGEQFEAAEENYFVQSLERQVSGITGAVEALINMREDEPAMLEYLDKVNELNLLDNETLTALRLMMPNQLANVREKERAKALEQAKKNKNQGPIDPVNYQP